MSERESKEKGKESLFKWVRVRSRKRFFFLARISRSTSRDIQPFFIVQVDNLYITIYRHAVFVIEFIFVLYFFVVVYFYG